MSERGKESEIQEDPAPRLSRRKFLGGLLAGGGILVGTQVPWRKIYDALDAVDLEERLGLWVHLGAKTGPQVVVGQAEMGQGVTTSLAMLLVEELDLELAQVEVHLGGAARGFRRPSAPGQYTGGSTSVRHLEEPLSRLAASIRDRLLRAASLRLGVDLESLTTQAGQVLHAKSQRGVSYQDLAEAAAMLPFREVEPRRRNRILGTNPPRVDLPAKVRGQARFGIDVRLPGLRFAAIRQGRRLAELPPKERDPEVQYLELESGVAAVGASYWQAEAALEGLGARDQEPPGEPVPVEARWRDLLSESPRSVSLKGPNFVAPRGDPQIFTNFVPFLAHQTLEPQTATAEFTQGRLKVWAPTQAQEAARDKAAEVAGLPADKVDLIATYLGGGFGRRFETDPIAQVVEIAKRVGAPVQLIWSREQDTRHDFYRPAALCQSRVWLEAGKIVGLDQTVVSPSILERVFPLLLWKGPDPVSGEGLREMPYQIPARSLGVIQAPSLLPVGFWRSVGHSANAFFLEHLFNQLAESQKLDPLEFRRAHLKPKSRRKKVLDALQRMQDQLARELPEASLGVALHESFGTEVGMVLALRAEVSRPEGVQVEKVSVVVEAGRVVHPDGFRSQVEGSVVFGLAAALRGEIGFTPSGVQPSSFHDAPLLRFEETPRVEVEILDSKDPPGGGGEPAVPPVAPALAHAYAKLTGTWIQRLPLARALDEAGSGAASG